MAKPESLTEFKKFGSSFSQELKKNPKLIRNDAFFKNLHKKSGTSSIKKHHPRTEKGFIGLVEDLTQKDSVFLIQETHFFKETTIEDPVKKKTYKGNFGEMEYALVISCAKLDNSIVFFFSRNVTNRANIDDFASAKMKKSSGKIVNNSSLLKELEKQLHLDFGPLINHTEVASKKFLVSSFQRKCLRNASSK